jgi:hypothetical protein
MQNQDKKEISKGDINVKENWINTFEGFVAAQNAPCFRLEKNLAKAYRSALENLEAATKELWSCMRTEDDGGSLLSYFTPEYENSMFKVDDCEKKLGEIQLDIENFIAIAGGYSRRDLDERLHRCKLDIENEKRKVRTTKKKAKLENPNMSDGEIGNLEIVKEAIERRDNIIAQLEPEIDELEIKLEACKEILLKYY